MAALAKSTGSPGDASIATNRKARRDYQVLEKLEAGVELKGAEVKSLRESGASLNESFARLEKGEVILQNLHIAPYSHRGSVELDPKRPRRLLLHRREIDKLVGQVQEKGRSLVPLSIYFKRGKVKVELAVCQGKQAQDKRETLKRKAADDEARRAMRSSRKR